MTFPVTPNPNIHLINPLELLREAQQELQALERVFAEIVTRILLPLIEAILNGLGAAAVGFLTPQGLANAIEGALGLFVADPANIMANICLALGFEFRNIPDFQIAMNSLAAAFEDMQVLVNDVDGGINTVVALINKVQPALDAIANALGFAGTGHTPANIQAYLTLLNGSVSGAVSNINSLISGVGGTAISDVSSAINTANNGVATLNTNLAGLESGIEVTLGSLGSAFVGLGVALNPIPFVNIAGAFLANIGADIEALAAALFANLASNPGSPASTAQVGQAMAQTAAQLDSASNIAQNATLAIAERAITKPSFMGIDPTADPVFNLTTLAGTTPTTVNVAQSTSVIGFIGTPDAGVKQSIAWLGQTTANITAMYINVYKVNTSTGALTWVFSSPNVIGSVSNSLTWNYYDLPTANYVTTAQGNWFAVEMRVLGTGTYQVVGMPNHWLPANANAFPSQLAASRTTPTNLARAVATGVRSSTTNNPTWSHAFVSGDAVIVDLVGFTNSSAITGYAVTFGGIAMTLLKFQAGPSSGIPYVASFGLLASALTGLSTGTQTVVVTTTGGGTSGTNCAVNGTSVSYSNVTAFGTPQSVTGTSTAVTQTVTGLTADNKTIIHEVLGAAANSLSAPTQNLIATLNNTASADPGVISDQIAYATSFAFSATANFSAPYAGIAIPLTCSVAPLAPATIGSPTYSANVPWFALCGSAGRSEIPPAATSYTAAGSYIYAVPPWMQSGDLFDVVTVGAGAGGYGATTSGYLGDGGGAGSWTAFTLRYGSDIPLSTTSFSVTVRAGGAGGFQGNAGAGGNTTIVITGYGTVTGTGGTPNNAQLSTLTSAFYGQSPGNETFNGVPYYGGGQQTVYAPGIAPGGGGIGSNVLNPGTAGAAGAAFILAYQGSPTAPFIVYPPAMIATTAMAVPTVKEILAPPVMSAIASMPVPSIFNGVQIQPPVMSATASMASPVITTGVRAPTMAATASMPAPALHQLPPVTFDATGSGGNSGGGGSSLSWTHTATAGAYVVAYVSVINNISISSITYGGTAMTLIGSSQMNNLATAGTIYLYGLSSAPSGSQTVSVTLSAGAAAAGCTVSYTGVNSVGAAATAFGSSTSLSQSIGCSAGQMISQAFGGRSNFSASSGGTTRYNSGPFAFVGAVIQDATSTSTFTATSPGGGSTAWAGIGVVLSPT